MEENAEQSQETVPFVVSNVDELERQAAAGTHNGYTDAAGIYQCALLPLMWQIDQENFITSRWNRGDRLTPNWVMGDEVTYGKTFKKGTVLATFDRRTGKYSDKGPGQGGQNHTVVFLGWVVEAPSRPGIAGLKDVKDIKLGMKVAEQFQTSTGGKPRIRVIYFDSNQPYHSNAGAFNVVRIKN